MVPNISFLWTCIQFEQHDLTIVLHSSSSHPLGTCHLERCLATPSAVTQAEDTKGKHVLITGGSSGIGKAVAIRAAQKGANVTILARNLDRLQLAVMEIKAARINPSQVIEYRQVESCSNYDNVAAAFGDIADVFLLINCAGTSIAGRFVEMDLGEFHRMMDNNYYSTVVVCKYLIPKMMAAPKTSQNKGIVFVSSLAGLMGLYGYTAYSASKFAVNGFAEALDMELKPYNIDITVHCPPDTKTPGYEIEQKVKPIETQKISEYGGLFSAEAVARNLLNQALKGEYLCSHGLDGWLSTIICSGMTCNTFFSCLAQVLLSTPLKLVAMIYRRLFNFTVVGLQKKSDIF